MKTKLNRQLKIYHFIMSGLILATLGILIPDCLELFADLLDGLNDRLYEFQWQAQRFYAVQ